MIALGAAVAEPVRVLGVILAAALAGVTLAATPPRPRAFAALGALVLIPLVLLAEIWDNSQLHTLRNHPPVFAALLLIALAVVVGAGWYLSTRPQWVAPLAVAALPFRIPIESGGSTSNLLVPLYVVIGAGTVAWALRVLRDPASTRRRAGYVEQLLAAAVALYALQAIYSSDVSKAIEQEVFFYIPFALLYVVLSDLDWDRKLALRCLGVLGALAAVFVVIGFWEYANRELLFNPKVIVSNQIEDYFRVNSLFFDPNIYGRFLAIVMLCLAGTLLWSTKPREQYGLAAALALLWGGLVVTFSQSSFTALLVGLAILGALRWHATRRTIVGVVAVFVVAAGFVAAFPGTVHLDLSSSDSVNDATSGRANLLKGGASLFVHRPLAGWGAGSFQREYRKQKKTSDQRATSASHTIPLTVAAEQGILGLVVYLALLAAALSRLFKGAGRDPLRSIIAAAFAALLVHTMLYAAFLEDPLTWTLLAAGGALAAAASARPASRRLAAAGKGGDDAADALAGLRSDAEPAPSA